MIPEDTHTEILRRITEAEKHHGVRVIYAVESGSRAWGFASPNSDFDVRFIYVHSREWYLSVDLEERRDVIEYPIVDDIDINGWDIRKALRLFWRSNPAIIEWLQSPIVYVDDNRFANTVRELLPEFYSLERGIYHYRSMARKNYRGYLKESTVPLKKYFYVLRPLLAIRWLTKYKRPAPIEFETLRNSVDLDVDINREITRLLDRKKISQEKDLIPAVPLINEFIESELDRLESEKPRKTDKIRDTVKLNDVFKEQLKLPDDK